MKLTRNVLAILALASFAFASDVSMDVKHHGAPAAESKEMKNHGQCKSCGMGTDKMATPKVRDTGPAEKDCSGPEYQG
jgi:hypothetical protein